MDDLLKYQSEKERIESFKHWPFSENSGCTAQKMAEAGFFWCGTEKEPDEAQCFVCLKKLDGWESDDDPWNEHKKHSSKCMYMKIGKKEAALTVYQKLDLSMESIKKFLKEKHEEKREMIIQEGKEMRKIIMKLRRPKSKKIKLAE